MRPHPAHRVILFVICAMSLAIGGVAAATEMMYVAHLAWGAAALWVLVVLLIQIARDLWRGQTGVDLVALLALAGSLVLGEYLAGGVIALMFASGQALEDYAASRAQRELSALLDRSPRHAHRYERESLVTVPVDTVQSGDRLLVKSGEVIPVDGLVITDTAVVDESALTGESLPVKRAPGESVKSGTLNAGNPFDIEATVTAANSTYTRMVQLVQQAQANKAPFARLADRYALIFVPLALVMACLAWGISGDSVRALAVLVVATPCPLLLAAPVALVSGMSRAAQRGILIKGGGALETLAQATVLLLDKTGTLTTGRARLMAIETSGDMGASELLRLSASLDQVSPHVVAMAIVAAARERQLRLDTPTAAIEHPGAGLEGTVERRQVMVGTFDWVATKIPPSSWAQHLVQRIAYEGLSGVFVAIDGQWAGALLLADDIRLETPKALRALRRAGIHKIIMLSGDRQDVAETIAAALGMDVVLAERSPEDKVEAVEVERGQGVTLMVGDGINDAPALAAADVGVAMGARGLGAPSEAADVVLLVDRLDRLADALHIARRSRGIARQSVIIGMGLSLLAMSAAMLGWLAPVAGALLQEGIDVAVLLNALRALRAHRVRQLDRTLPQATVDQLMAEHRQLDPLVERLDAVARDLDTLAPAAMQTELETVARDLQTNLLPHETTDDATLYPALAELLGGEDPMGMMSRTHREITHLARQYTRLVAALAHDGINPEDRRELRRILYSLSAILRLHFAQEEELFATLVR
jgi:heavy metal translocating P-type ATPase